jgi:hypothetical protein
MKHPLPIVGIVGFSCPEFGITVSRNGIAVFLFICFANIKNSVV